MTTTMIVLMDIHDAGWMADYFENVPALLREYGATVVSVGTDIAAIEGEAGVPDRIAVIEFPSRDAVDSFMADPRYARHRSARKAGSNSQIYLVSNAVRARAPA